MDEIYTALASQDKDAPAPEEATTVEPQMKLQSIRPS